MEFQVISRVIFINNEIMENQLPGLSGLTLVIVVLEIQQNAYGSRLQCYQLMMVYYTID